MKQVRSVQLYINPSWQFEEAHQKGWRRSSFLTLFRKVLGDNRRRHQFLLLLFPGSPGVRADFTSRWFFTWQQNSKINRCRAAVTLGFWWNIDHFDVILTTNFRISTISAKWSIIDQWSIISTHWPACIVVKILLLQISGFIKKKT